MSTAKPRIILSIDPGYDRLGWAIGSATGSEYHPLDFGCIQTTRNADLFDRYRDILEQLGHIIEKHAPTQAAIEQLFFSKNSTTAMKVAEARGIIIGQLVSQHIPVFEYHPSHIKQAVTGYGNADKQAVTKMTLMQLHLPPERTKKLLDDTVDALALGLTHAVTQRQTMV